MLVPIFTLNLNQKILPGKVTIGRFDGAHACLTASTTSDKVNTINRNISFSRAFLGGPRPSENPGLLLDKKKRLGLTF